MNEGFGNAGDRPRTEGHDEPETTPDPMGETPITPRGTTSTMAEERDPLYTSRDPLSGPDRPMGSEGPAGEERHSASGERTWTEQIEVAGGQLVDRVKELLQEGNVRRLIIRRPDDSVLLEVPLAAGVAVTGAVTLIAPLLAALGAMAALVAKVKVEIVRQETGE